MLAGRRLPRVAKYSSDLEMTEFDPKKSLALLNTEKKTSLEI
jgi:hypothetical protein